MCGTAAVSYCNTSRGDLSLAVECKVVFPSPATKLSPLIPHMSSAGLCWYRCPRSHAGSPGPALIVLEDNTAAEGQQWLWSGSAWGHPNSCAGTTEQAPAVYAPHCTSGLHHPGRGLLIPGWPIVTPSIAGRPPFLASMLPHSHLTPQPAGWGCRACQANRAKK